MIFQTFCVPGSLQIRDSQILSPDTQSAQLSVDSVAQSLKRTQMESSSKNVNWLQFSKSLHSFRHWSGVSWGETPTEILSRHSPSTKHPISDPWLTPANREINRNMWLPKMICILLYNYWKDLFENCFWIINLLVYVWFVHEALPFSGINKYINLWQSLVWVWHWELGLR